MLRFICLYFCVFACDLLPLLASQHYNYPPVALSAKDYESNESQKRSDVYTHIISANHSQSEDVKFISEKNKINYGMRSLVKNEESQSTFYYRSPVQAKSFLSRFFIGNHFSARMDTFQNLEIPFLARARGVATELSTQSTNFSASYFKSNAENPGKSKTQVNLVRKKQPLASDTKLALAIPFLPQFKLFGGYSYNRSIESRLTKGPSFGFQADIFDHIKVDTTFVKQTVGKTAAKVLFSFNMPLERIRF